VHQHPHQHPQEPLQVVAPVVAPVEELLPQQQLPQHLEDVVVTCDG
jgi:hypothetical protein